jgi:hypothetical protein
LAALAGPGLASAAAPNYSYVEVGYNDVDIEGESLDGFFAGASFGGKNFHVFGRYNDNDADLIDITTWWLGGGWHGGLGEKADVIAEVAYLDTSVDVLSLGDASDSGYFARGGVRWRLIKLFEIGGWVRYQDIADDTDTGYELNAIFNVWRIGIGLGYEDISDAETLNAFVRFNFGGAQ